MAASDDLAESWLRLTDNDIRALRHLAGHVELIRLSAELCGWVQGMLDNLADHKTKLRGMPLNNGPWLDLTNTRLVRGYRAAVAIELASGISGTLSEWAVLVRDQFVGEMCARLTAAEQLGDLIVESGIDKK